MNATEQDEPEPIQARVAVIVLAAGLGTRMRSDTPKLLHSLAGAPILEHVFRAAEAIHPGQLITTIGPTTESIRERFVSRSEFAFQLEPLGTADAVVAALPLVDGEREWILVLCGDVPLIRHETLTRFISATVNANPLLSMLTFSLDEPGSYGRLHFENGRVARIMEAADDSGQYSGPIVLNSGICCFRRSWLEDHLPSVPRSRSGEYYLTSLVELAARHNGDPDPILVVPGDSCELTGIDDRVKLADAERVIRRRINTGHMINGVTMVDSDRTYVDIDVEIGADTVIEPGCVLRGKTSIGPGCIIGPYSVIEDSIISNGVTIRQSWVTSSVVEEDVSIGPYSHLRPGSTIRERTHIGNYVETKNAEIGNATRIGHFSYIGDATLGERVNVGAGTITCNFDGVDKHRTDIDDDVFLGSDTMLIAPVRVGTRARTGAGAVVTRSVPPGKTVVGVPARLVRSRRSASQVES